MNAPTLLIGLGGTGCKIIERVSKMVTGEQRNNIAFAVFDTDINDLRGIQERNPFIKTIQTSTKQTVGEYLNKDTHARDTWFPVNAILNGKTLTEGAGQVRSISRLALETVIRAGKMEPLHEAIQSLYKVEEDKADQALRVVIVSSLAGGTGSGLILPVALYTRNYLQTHFRQSANITRGFFILPEVFYEVITGQTERNNLKANAYATLRELDAFLMKGDATLHERYANSVRMQFPRAASNGYEEYDVRPYDFCFLFDAQNAEGGKLNSFDQYLDHAANCIYAQSIGPMNKRSNSSEDNTIRKLAKERGRNRYAGAGASMLVYPFEDIRTLIALKWTKQCVSKQWMVFDDLYKELCKENDQKREQGLSAKEQSLSAFYANQVESAAKHDDAFAKAIIKSTGKYTNGVTRTADRWKEYVLAVLSKIEHDLEDCSSDLSSKYDDAREQINNLGNDWEEFANAFAAAEEYRLMSSAYVEEVSQTIAYSMFRGSKVSQSNIGLSYKLETYLVSADNKFLHPNAIRYMLIKILDLMKKQKESVDKDRDDNRQYFETFEKNTFDIAETEDVEETVDDLSDRKTSLVSRLTKRPTGEQEEMKRKFKVFFDTIGAYQVQCAQSFVLGQGIDYIESLISAFESFYKSFDSKVAAIDKAINDIYKKYSDSKGTTVRYLRVRGWSNNSLTLARKREVLARTKMDLTAINHCDFCGLPLSGVSYERLNDGRIRCNDCSSSAISKPDDFRELFYRTLGMMEDFFEIRYRVPIRVKMADARTVAKGAGMIFKPSTGVAPRVLGFAQRKNGKYSLLVENGSPRLATIDTMVHEMTHIWQYLNWDDKQIASIYGMNDASCSGIARDIVYEGMAMWASIQYLYQIGETFYAMQQETLAETRQDVYGIGFRLYQEQYPLVKDSSLLKYSPFSSFPTLEPSAVQAAVKSRCTKKECKC